MHIHKSVCIWVHVFILWHLWVFSALSISSIQHESVHVLDQKLSGALSFGKIQKNTGNACKSRGPNQFKGAAHPTGLSLLQPATQVVVSTTPMFDSALLSPSSSVVEKQSQEETLQPRHGQGPATEKSRWVKRVRTHPREHTVQTFKVHEQRY